LRCPPGFGKDPRGAPCHFCGRAAGESQQQDSTGIRAVYHEVSDTMGKRVRLAGPGTCDDQKRASESAGLNTVLNRSSLAFVQVHK
jgi:hypothetical protein